MEKLFDKKVAIIVSSCDGFKDCWLPFIHSLNKYGQKCPYDVYFVSCSDYLPSCSTAGEGVIKFIPVGKDLGWASNLKIALSLISEDYVIYLQEDYFLNKAIVWQDINQHVAYCIRNGIDYLRLTFPYLPGQIKDYNYVENHLSQAYAVCLQAALWRKSILEKLCIEGWSGWDFERQVATYISKHIPNFRFLTLSKKAKGQISYVRGTAVRKGKWTNSGYRFLKRNGFQYLLSQRVKEPFYYELIDVGGIWRPLAKIMWYMLDKCWFLK